MKKLFGKKVIALFLAMTMVFSLAGFNALVQAETTVDTSSLGLVSTSNYVSVMSDRILVMSHYDDSRYFVSSESLLNSLTSTDYTLSYVDANKNVPAEVVKSVKDGYILCEKDGEIPVYVPVVRKGNLVDYSKPGNVAATGASFSNIASLGGKSANDTAKAITVADTAISGGSFPRYEFSLSSITNDGGNTICNEPFAVETNIYADGDTTLQISVRTYVILQWLPNGELWGMNSTSCTDFANSKVKLADLERGKWHHLTIGYDLPRNRILVFADGKRLTNAGSKGLDATTQLNNSMRFGLADGSVNGTVAIDDAVGYEGYFYTSDDKVTLTATSDITLDSATNTVNINGNNLKTTAMCNEALKAAFGGTYAALLKSDLTPAETLNEAEFVIASSATGRVYNYYNVQINQDLTAYLGLTSSSGYVRVLDDEILVFSHSDDSRYFIRSDATDKSVNTANGDVSFGLFSVLSSEAYELSYVDANKNAPAEVVKSVKDGYVLCKNDSEEIYVPVTYKDETISYPVYTSDNMEGQNSKVVYGKDKTAIGGKSETDTSCYITVGETPVESDKFARIEYSISKIMANGGLNDCDEPFTVEANVYADGDATLQIAIRTYTILQWRPNGEVWGMNSTSATDFASSAVKIGNLERGKWHRLTIGYDIYRNRVTIYADGNRLTNSGSNNTLGKTGSVGVLNHTIRYGLCGDSVNGTVAVDDVIGYKGYYYPSYDKVEFGTSDNMKLDGTVLYADKNAFTDYDNFIEAAKNAFGVNEVALLSSSLERTDSFDDAKILLVVSESGRVYKYFDVEFVSEEKFSAAVYEEFSASTPVDSDISDGVKVQLYTFVKEPVQKYHGNTEAGIGVKSDDDYAYVITSENDVITDGYNTPQIDLKKAITPAGRYLTLEFDLYKENHNVDAAAFVVTNTGARIDLVNIRTNDGIVAGNLGRVMANESGRWYKVACTIDTEEDVWTIYINGKEVASYTPDNTTANLDFETINRFVVYEYYSTGLTAEKIKAAKIAIDNYRVYNSLYNPENDIVDITVSEPYALDSYSSLIVADSVDNIKKSDIASIINTNGLEYKVFADSTYTTELSDDDIVTADTVIVVYSADGESFGYYRFSEPFTDEINIYLASDKKTIIASGFTNDISCDYDIIIAAYNGNKLEDVNVENITPYTYNEIFIDYNENYTYKAFIWVNGALKPVDTISFAG